MAPNVAESPEKIKVRQPVCQPVRAKYRPAPVRRGARIKMIQANPTID
jgi:hypothetical protein